MRWDADRSGDHPPSPRRKYRLSLVGPGLYPELVSLSQAEYVLDDEGWHEAERLAATYQALALVAPDATDAETDIPWYQHDRWPSAVVQAAQRLRDRFVQEGKRSDDYMRTGVEPLVDDLTRSDFVTFAPYAYDATIWAGEEVLASLSDEGTSLVVLLTGEQRLALEGALGPGRVVTVQAWRDRHQSALRRLLRLLRDR